MRTKKTIAVIGAGRMGKAIASALSKSNERVLLYSRDFDKASLAVDLLKSSSINYDIEAMSCSVDACWEADIIIPAMNYSGQAEVAEKIRQMANQKIVLSIVNPLNKTFDALVTESSAAEELQELLPNSKVVKAFNSIFSTLINEPILEGIHLDMLLASNDEDALVTVAELVKSIGFKPLFVGNLKICRILELMPIILFKINEYNHFKLSAFKILHD